MSVLLSSKDKSRLRDYESIILYYALPPIFRKHYGRMVFSSCGDPIISLYKNLSTQEFISLCNNLLKEDDILKSYITCLRDIRGIMDCKDISDHYDYLEKCINLGHYYILNLLVGHSYNLDLSMHMSFISRIAKMINNMPSDKIFNFLSTYPGNTRKNGIQYIYNETMKLQISKHKKEIKTLKEQHQREIEELLKPGNKGAIMAKNRFDSNISSLQFQKIKEEIKGLDED